MVSRPHRSAVDLELRLHPAARLLATLYGLVRAAALRRVLATLIGRLEGGHMRSGTLRAVLEAHHDVVVGAHTYGSLLIPGRADAMTTIGRYVSIGPDVRRLGAAHPIGDLSMHPYWYHASLGLLGRNADVDRTPIEIGDDCWIGANVTILPGCRRIGTGAVVGAGAVVTRDVKDFEVVAGVPARPISMRLDPRQRTELLQRRPWDLPPDQYRHVLDEIEQQNE